jgi:integrase
MAGGVTKLPLQYVHEYRDRHGKLRRYFRRGSKKTVLPGLPGSDEFMATYRAALAGIAASPPTIGASRTKPGTVNAAIVGYYQSLTFRALASSTQRKRRLILERFREKHGGKSIATLPQSFIRHSLDKQRPFAARNLLKALRSLLTFAVAEGFCADDPTAGLKLPKVKSDGVHTWMEDEIEQFERHYPTGTKERLALALLLRTAQRVGDVVRMGRQHVRDGAIAVRQGKTGAQLSIPIAESLRRELGFGNLTFLVTERGKPFTLGGFGDWFKRRCREAGLPHCSAHGLRKAACRRLAEAGCTAHEIAAISGHASLKEVERYTRAADQARLARRAMKRERDIG